MKGLLRRSSHMQTKIQREHRLIFICSPAAGMCDKDRPELSKKGGQIMLKNLMWNIRCRLMYDDSGIGVIEVILILVVLIGLVIIFRDQIESIANTILSNIADEADTV